MTLQGAREHLAIPTSIVMIATLLIVPAIIGAGDAIGQTVVIPVDDVDYYRGVFFAEGQLAEQIPEIRDYLMMDTEDEDPQVVQIITDFRARLTNVIGNQDPTFFTEFAAAMQSGDPYVIDAAIHEGAEVTMTAIRSMPEIVSLRNQMQADPELAGNMIEDMAGTAELADTAVLMEVISLLGASDASNPSIAGSVSNATSVVVVLVMVAAVVVATYAGAAHAVAAVFSVALAAVIVRWVAAWQPKPKNRSPYGNLQREQLINAIASFQN